MKNLIIGCIVVLMQASPGNATLGPKSASNITAQELSSPIKLNLSADHLTITLDGDINLSVKFVNGSNEVFDCASGAISSPINEGYAYDVRMSDGRVVSRVPEKGPPQFDPVTPCRVRAGQTAQMFLGCVTCAFEMRRPGIYTIQVSLPDRVHPGQVLGTSNKITVEVTAPK